MAYSLVVDTSNFKPYDFGQAFLVLREVVADRLRREDLLNKIYEEMGKYSLPESSKYSELLKKFYEDLDAASENFYNSNGSGESKRAIKDMWRRYTKEMTPIRQAVENYNKGLETLAKLGPDAIVANREALNNIDTYYGGVNPLVDYRSKSNIQALAAKAVLSLDSALQGAPELAGLISNQYLIFKSKGLNNLLAIELILAWHPELRNQEGIDATSLLTLTLDELYQQLKFNNDVSENVDIQNSIILGAMMGLLAPKYTIQGDRSYRSSAQITSDTQAAQNNAYELAKKEAELEITNLLRGYIKTNLVDENGMPVYILDIDLSKARTKATSSQEKTPENTLPKGTRQFTYKGDKGYAISIPKNKNGVFEVLEVYRWNESIKRWDPIGEDESIKDEIRKAYKTRPLEILKSNELTNEKPDSAFNVGLSGW